MIMSFGSLPQDPVVNLTPSCDLRGKLIKAKDGSRDVCAFLSVPYGQPPTGQLHFAVPQPAALWDGIKDAIQFGETDNILSKFKYLME